MRIVSILALAAAVQAIDEFHSIGAAKAVRLNEDAPFQPSNPIIAAKRDSQDLEARDIVPLILSRTIISSYCALAETGKTTLVPYVTTVNGVVTTKTSTVCDCSLTAAPSAGSKAALSVVVQTTTIDGVVKTITTTVCESTDSAKTGNNVAPIASPNTVPAAAAAQGTVVSPAAAAQGTVVAPAAPGKQTVAAGNGGQAPAAETLHSVAAESVAPAGSNTVDGAQPQGTAHATPTAIVVSASPSAVPNVTQSFEGGAARGFGIGGVLVALGLLFV